MNLDAGTPEAVCSDYVHLTLRRMRGLSGVRGHPSRSLSASSNISVTYRQRGGGGERKGIKMTARLKIGSAHVTFVLKAVPLQSISSPPSLSPGECREWRHPRSRPALHPEWGTGAPSLRGFFPGSSYDLSPSATLCAWMHRDRAVWLGCQLEIDLELSLVWCFSTDIFGMCADFLFHLPILLSQI